MSLLVLIGKTHADGFSSRRIVNANKKTNFETASLMMALLVKAKENSWQNTRMRTKKTRPIAIEVLEETITANLADFPFTVPSSFTTLTLH